MSNAPWISSIRKRIQKLRDALDHIDKDGSFTFESSVPDLSFLNSINCLRDSPQKVENTSSSLETNKNVENDRKTSMVTFGEDLKHEYLHQIDNVLSKMREDSLFGDDVKDTFASYYEPDSHDLLLSAQSRTQADLLKEIHTLRNENKALKDTLANRKIRKKSPFLTARNPTRKNCRHCDQLLSKGFSTFRCKKHPKRNKF